MGTHTQSYQPVSNGETAHKFYIPLPRGVLYLSYSFSSGVGLIFSAWHYILCFPHYMIYTNLPMGASTERFNVSCLSHITHNRIHWHIIDNGGCLHVMELVNIAWNRTGFPPISAVKQLATTQAAWESGITRDGADADANIWCSIKSRVCEWSAPGRYHKWMMIISF